MNVLKLKVFRSQLAGSDLDWPLQSLAKKELWQHLVEFCFLPMLQPDDSTISITSSLLQRASGFLYKRKDQVYLFHIKKSLSALFKNNWHKTSSTYLFKSYNVVSFDTHETVNIIKIIKMSLTFKGFLILLFNLFLLPLLLASSHPQSTTDVFSAMID